MTTTATSPRVDAAAGFPTALFTITGQPGEIEAAASRYGDFAATAYQERSRVASTMAPSWIGSEGDLFRSRVSQYPPLLDTAGGVFADITVALNTFASTMTTQQQAMTQLRAEAEVVWQQLQAARAALASAQASLTALSAALVSAQPMAVAQASPQMATATTAATDAATRVAQLEAQWESCCRRAEAIHTTMEQAAQTAAGRVKGLAAPGAVPPPSLGGATASTLALAISALAPLPISPSALDDAAVGLMNTAGPFGSDLSQRFKNELTLNSWYSSLGGGYFDLANWLAGQKGLLPGPLRNLPPWFRIPTVNSLADGGEAIAKLGRQQLDGATARLGARESRIAELARLTHDHPLNLWNQAKLIGNEAFLLPWAKFDAATAKATNVLAQATRATTFAGQLPFRILAPLDSFTTMADSKNATFDRYMAAANLGGTALAEAKPLASVLTSKTAQRFAPRLAGLAADAGAAAVRVLPGASRLAVVVPGVGQGVAAVTGAYLAGKWLYDHYDPAKESMNAVGSLAKSAAVDGIWHGDWSKVGGEVQKAGATLAAQSQRIGEDISKLPDNAMKVAKDIGQDAANAVGDAANAVGDVGRSAVDRVKSLF